MKFGIDMIEVGRIAKSIRRPKFVERIYTQCEREYLVSKGWNPQSAAGMFAAKEAFSKAAGTGMRGFFFSDIEVRHTAEGMPYLRLYRGAERVAGGRQLSLSISHTGRYAVAIAGLEDRPPVDFSDD